MRAHLRLQPAADNDIEALQTDIMRFMAILGFCLMVIFAMVQSLPQVERDDTPKLASRELVQQDIDQLQAEVETLKQELAVLLVEASVERQSLEAMTEQVEALQQNLAAAEDTLRSQAVDLLTMQRQIRRERAEAERLEANKEAVRLRLAAIEQERERERAQQEAERLRNEALARTAVEDRAQALREQALRAQAIRDQARRDAEQAAQAAIAAAQAASAPEEPPEQPPETPPSSTEERGLELIFASDEIFTSLLRHGRIRFYVGKDGQYFRLHADGRVALEAVDAEVYQMASHTVPSQLLRMAARRLTVSSDKFYGVTLDPTIERQLSTLMRQHRSGKLVIGANGKVSHSSLKTG